MINERGKKIWFLFLRQQSLRMSVTGRRRKWEKISSHCYDHHPVVVVVVASYHLNGENPWRHNFFLHIFCDALIHDSSHLIFRFSFFAWSYFSFCMKFNWVMFFFPSKALLFWIILRRKKETWSWYAIVRKFISIWIIYLIFAENAHYHKILEKITQNAFMIQCVLRRKEADEDEI